jgi:preprotein translocase subunit SecY
VSSPQAALAEAMNSRDLRSRISWLFIGFFIFALAVHVPIPGINRGVWENLLAGGELFQMLGMFTGNALNKFSIVALGITPYINASIIMQLLTVVTPQLKDMQKEGGEIGRRQIVKYTRWLCIGLAFIQATVMTISLSRYGQANDPSSWVFYSRAPLFLACIVVTLVAGTCFMIWLGETMSEKSLGSGVSLLIFAGIVMSYPMYLMKTLQAAQAGGARAGLSLVVFFLMSLGVVVSIIIMTLAVRKVPIQFPKRQVGNRVMGGQSTFIPVKVNNAGVISIIFAVSLMYLPSTLVGMIPETAPEWAVQFKEAVKGFLNSNNPFYNVFYAAMVIFFTYFYSSIAFSPEDIADNLKKQGGFIPGIRPGRATSEYLHRLLNRLNLVSGLFLAGLAIVPNFIMKLTNVNSFYLGSTSLLIIVGVALDTMSQIQARMVLRNYQGFMK